MAPAIPEDDKISATTQPPSQPNASDTFTLFPKLLVKLRLVIWKLALPQGSAGDGKRLICVKGILNGGHKIIEGQSVECKFHPVTADERLSQNSGRWRPTQDETRQLKAEAKADEEHSKDVRLLKTCCESRGTYLKAFPNVLLVHPTKYDGQIRFNDECTLYVVNMLEFDFSRKIFEAKKLKCKLPNLKNVRSLAITIPKLYDQEGACSGLLFFKCLDSVKISYFPHTRFANVCTCCENRSRRTSVDHSAKDRQDGIIKHIEVRISQIDPDFRLPKIEHPH